MGSGKPFFRVDETELTAGSAGNGNSHLRCAGDRPVSVAPRLVRRDLTGERCARTTVRAKGLNFDD